MLKADNLKKLKENKFNVPEFITAYTLEDYNQKCSLLQDNELYAVRSSFDGEDGATSSFAGQFETLLNIKRENVPSAIQRVLASVNSQCVSEYENAKQLKTALKGCVIVQRMVKAEMSGVIFTSNPNGALNELVINIGYGYGPSVVEDKIETASYFYNKDDKVFYREGTSKSPTISDKLVDELIKNALRAEELFKCPIDMEFAIENDTVYILQARPITTINWDDVIILDNSNIIESYPGISLPLTQDFVKTIYHEIFYNLLVRVTKNKKAVDNIDKYLINMVDVVNWRMYYRISNWYSVLHLMPMSSKVIPMWQKMLGVNNTNISFTNKIKVPISAKIQIVLSVLKYLKITPCEMEALNNKFEQKAKEYEELINKAETVGALLAVYENIRQDILIDWDITLINDMYAFIYSHLAGKKNKDTINKIKGIELESMRPATAMNNLLFIARESGVDSDEYIAASNDYIEKYGDRCVGELKLETKTYRTNPELLDEFIIHRLSTQVGQYVNKPDIYQSDSHKGVVKKAKTGIYHREISRLNRSKLFGICRSIFLKIGEIMRAERRLDCREDVFYLHMNEIRINKDYKDLVEKRKMEAEMYESVPAYSRLIFSGHVVNKNNPVIEEQILGKENHLCGIATSAGVIRGKVLVIDDPNKKVDINDKIIVTKSTDPGWVFLVQQCSGVIAEKGSLLSHTAIISRELHKPAVVNVKDCTRLLKDGDLVELDANNGIITILERG